MKPHKHSEVIHAWADGKPVQVWSEKHQRWEDRTNPIWLNEWRYRVKPTHVYDPFINKFVSRVSHG